MTKAQLIKTLEPFDDDIQVIIIDNSGHKVLCPSIYYKFTKDMDEAIVIVSGVNIKEKGSVELKIK